MNRMDKYLRHIAIILALVYLILFITDMINGGMMLTDRSFVKWVAALLAAISTFLCVKALMRPVKKRKTQRKEQHK